MKLAVQENMVPGRSVAEKMEKLRKFGYDGIEVWGRGLLERVDELKKASADTGVPISTICAGYGGAPLSGDPKLREQAWREIGELLQAAGELGAVGLIVVPVFVGHQPRIPDLSPLMTQREAEDRLLVKCCRRAAPTAKKAGTCILLEPLNRGETNYMRTVAHAQAVCEKVAHPNVCLMADFYHMNIEELDIPSALKKAAKHVKHIHLAGNTRLLPNYGSTNFRAGFAALKSIGYANFMALECGIPGPPEKELPKTARWLRECIEG